MLLSDLLQCWSSLLRMTCYFIGVGPDVSVRPANLIVLVRVKNVRPVAVLVQPVWKLCSAVVSFALSDPSARWCWSG